MAKIKSVYICRECAYEAPKWYGKCPGCGQWNSLYEDLRQDAPIVGRPAATGGKVLALADVETQGEERYDTGFSELNRVLGGGLVMGSLVLLGGDPGIGKSTLLMQICGHLGNQLDILYVSGEESPRQLKLRAKRLRIDAARLLVLAETDLEHVIGRIEEQRPGLVMIDSIQTMNLASVSSSPGSITQVRECTNLLMHTAKRLGIPVILVGHVNKDGAIAGPKVLEHIVDAVLYFEGERNHTYRILRAVKNRFGSTNEIGVFEMRDTGLAEVPNPSMMLLNDRPQNVSGSCVACLIEGSRPILAEVQGLVTPTGFGNPRRMSTGFDYNRMALLMAVLEKRAGFYFGNQDAYINVVGGLRIDEPAADLTVALALVSSLKDLPVNEKTLAFGEVGLSGEIRAVSHVEQRISEASRMGFTHILLPRSSLKHPVQAGEGVRLTGVHSLRDAVATALR